MARDTPREGHLQTTCGGSVLARWLGAIGVVVWMCVLFSARCMALWGHMGAFFWGEAAAGTSLCIAGVMGG